MIGYCRARPCRFTWSRRHDFRVFFRKDNGAGFSSAGELESTMSIGAQRIRVAFIEPATPTLVELLRELLVATMQRPPTARAIGLWSFDQQRRAVRWATREILADDVVAGPGRREPRPLFIEEGAATA